jgi:hypothetical protein
VAVGQENGYGKIRLPREESWEWVKQALRKLASEDPEGAPDLVKKIVETIRIERPDLFGLAQPTIPIL